jgi:hypothetical protein
MASEESRRIMSTHDALASMIVKTSTASTPATAIGAGGNNESKSAAAAATTPTPSSTDTGNNESKEEEEEESDDDDDDDIGDSVGLEDYTRVVKLLRENEDSGVYYDGGWSDMARGSYQMTLSGDMSSDNSVVSKDLFNRLRKTNVLGGNRLVTYKARRWHPTLRPGDIDGSKLGDRFYRQAPYDPC